MHQARKAHLNPTKTCARFQSLRAAVYMYAVESMLVLARVLIALLALTVAHAAVRPISSTFLHAQCDGHRRVYSQLIANQLSPYRTELGLSVNDILKLEGPADPQALIVNGVVMTKGVPVINMASYWVPLLKRVSSKVLLPDLVLAGDVWDGPEDDASRDGGPWFGYCNYVSETTNLMLPAGGGVTKHLRCGRDCVPFTSLDKREPKGIFLGSSTGWWVGRRRAAILAGILHNETIYSGYTQMIDLPYTGLPEEDGKRGLNKTKPHMALPEQVKSFKYIINADGHCAALRLRQLLASDSAVLWVGSNQIEWFYPLLQPYVHYIPVRYLAYEPEDPLHDVVTKIEWAERHPDKVAAIVKNANRFATAHLSDHAILCYTVQLLDEYSRLFHDPHKLQASMQQGNFSTHHIEAFK